MECDICRCTEWIRHCPCCGGDFCDVETFVYKNGLTKYECPNGCDSILELYPETVPEED